VPFMRWCRKIF